MKQLNEQQEKLAIWFKQEELKALEKSHKMKVTSDLHYWQGKAQAFSESWAMIVFNGEYTPEEYNWANSEYNMKANK